MILCFYLNCYKYSYNITQMKMFSKRTWLYEQSIYRTSALCGYILDFTIASSGNSIGSSAVSYSMLWLDRIKQLMKSHYHCKLYNGLPTAKSLNSNHFHSVLHFSSGYIHVSKKTCYKKGRMPFCLFWCEMLSWQNCTMSCVIIHSHGTITIEKSAFDTSVDGFHSNLYTSCTSNLFFFNN